MFISSGFDGGNIKVLRCEDAQNIELAINKDRNSDFYQWFYFRLTGARAQACKIQITNAGGAAYPEGYENYRAVASYDRETWFRVDTRFDGRTLTIDHQPEFNAVFYAYFAPYSMERHADMIADVLTSPLADLERLGATLEGQDMDLLRIGEPGENKRTAWFIARQHPGETMAEWWMEGFLARLLDEDDPVSRTLLEHFVFYVVPNMNPDGSCRGHLRTNIAGANLNREWLEPCAERSPEVLLVREKMHATGVDFCMDIHGDEALPYNFIAGSQGIPSWNEARQALLEAYLEAFKEASPDFQTKHGYDVPQPGEANLTKATNYVAETFNCLAMTLEMPFKDNADAPNHQEGWSPNRARHLGASSLSALYAVRNRLPS